MKRLSLPLALLLSACAVNTSGQSEPRPNDYSAFLASIEKRRNHHTENVDYIAPVTMVDGNQDVRYVFSATKYRDTKGVPEYIFLTIKGRFDQPGFLDSALVNGRPIELGSGYIDPECQSDWCPTEAVRLTLSKRDLDTFSAGGSRIVFTGAAGSIDVTIPPDYSRAFRDSFTRPPEWTTVAKGF